MRESSNSSGVLPMAKSPTRETAKERAAREERERQDANATRRAEAEAASARALADAEARKVEAQAKGEQARAQAEVDRMRAEAEAQRIKAEADAAKRRADAEEAARQAAEANAPAERAYQLGINVGAPVAGYVAGVQLAKNIGAKHAAGVDAANKQLKALGTQIAKTIPKTGMPKPATVAKLTGMVKSADALRLASRPTALGLATAGIVLAEGAFARFVLAPQAGDNKVAKEALGAVGTASIFTATTLVGKRLIANATTMALPDAKAVAAVETARKLLPAATSAPAKVVTAAPSLAEKAGKIAAGLGKAKGPALILSAAGAAVAVSATSKPADAAPAGAPLPASMLTKAAEIGLTTASSVQAARLVTNPAARAAASVLSKMALPLAAVAAVAGGVDGARRTGTVGGTLEGAADGLTGGGYSWIKDKVAEILAPVPGPEGAPGASSLALMQGAAHRTAAEMQRTTVAADEIGPAGAASDGQTEGYTRTRNGRVERVKGYATPTAAR